MSEIFKRIKAIPSWENYGAGILLLLGIVLRIRQYLTGRSLWLDEAMLALNIVNRNFAGMFRSLDYDQGAPIGFLLIEKLLNIMLGDHEFVLRLFPLVAGIASLFLFYWLLRRTTSGVGLLAGLTLFAVGPELIFYSSEVKQYILDVTIIISLLLLALPLAEKRGTKRENIFLGLGGFLAMWFSHPALFVLAGIGIVLLIQSLKQRDYSQVGSLLLMGTIWLVNLGLLYFVSLRGLSQNSFLLDYWDENFMPVPPWTGWNWFGITFKGLIQNQIGIQVSAWLVFILVAAGLFFLFTENKIYAGMLSIIFTLAILASGLRLYPFGGRLSLFLVPLIIILISQSIDSLGHQLESSQKWSRLIPLVIGLYLLYAPASESFYNFIDPKYPEHIRPSMATLSENWQPGDALFVSYGAAPAFRFYAERYGLGDVDFQTSTASDYSEPSRILSHLDALDGNPRVWVLITHVYERGDFNEKDFILNYLDSIGKKKREFRHPGTSVHLFLYDLSQ